MYTSDDCQPRPKHVLFNATNRSIYWYIQFSRLLWQNQGGVWLNKIPSRVSISTAGCLTLKKTLNLLSSVRMRAKFSHRNKSTRKIFVGVRREDKMMNRSESTFALMELKWLKIQEDSILGSYIISFSLAEVITNPISFPGRPVLFSA
jgi:hypothetical protein